MAFQKKMQSLILRLSILLALTGLTHCKKKLINTQVNKADPVKVAASAGKGLLTQGNSAITDARTLPKIRVSASPANAVLENYLLKMTECLIPEEVKKRLINLVTKGDIAIHSDFFANLPKNQEKKQGPLNLVDDDIAQPELSRADPLPPEMVEDPVWQRLARGDSRFQGTVLTPSGRTGELSNLKNINGAFPLEIEHLRTWIGNETGKDVLAIIQEAPIDGESERLFRLLNGDMKEPIGILMDENKHAMAIIVDKRGIRFYDPGGFLLVDGLPDKYPATRDLILQVRKRLQERGRPSAITNLREAYHLQVTGNCVANSCRVLTDELQGAVNFKNPYGAVEDRLDYDVEQRFQFAQVVQTINLEDVRAKILSGAISPGQYFIDQLKSEISRYQASFPTQSELVALKDAYEQFTLHGNPLPESDRAIFEMAHPDGWFRQAVQPQQEALVVEIQNREAHFDQMLTDLFGETPELHQKYKAEFQEKSGQSFAEFDRIVSAQTHVDGVYDKVWAEAGVKPAARGAMKLPAIGRVQEAAIESFLQERASKFTKFHFRLIQKLETNPISELSRAQSSPPSWKRNLAIGLSIAIPVAAILTAVLVTQVGVTQVGLTDEQTCSEQTLADLDKKTIDFFTQKASMDQDLNRITAVFLLENKKK